MNFSHLLYKVSERVATITLNRPNEMNRLNMEVWKEIDTAFDRAIGASEVNAILLSANGESFSMGFDVHTATSKVQTGIWEKRVTLQKEREYWMKIWDCPKPVVCAVQGNCIAGGYGLATLADIIIAADDAVFSEPEVRYSMVAQPQTIYFAGIRRAKEMLMLGDNISAEEAYRWGIINRVVPREELEAEARKIAVKLALMPTETIQMTKSFLNRAIDRMGYREMGDWGWDLFFHSRLIETKQKDEFNQIVNEHGMEEAIRRTREKFNSL